MYDIQKLEEEWSIYNRKRKRPLFITLFLLIVLGATVTTVYLNDSLRDKFKDIFDNNSKIIVSKDVQSVPSQEANISLQNEPEKPVQIIKAPKIIIEKEPNPYDRASNEPVLEDVESLARTEDINTFSQEDKTSSKKMHLDILETSSITAYKDVESRFYQTHDTDDSLFLAKSYFNRGEYKKAEYWALQTNKVDNSIEESWLLFAQAKAKLGQKEDAIKVLKSYINKSNSLEARRLLEKIK